MSTSEKSDSPARRDLQPSPWQRFAHGWNGTQASFSHNAASSVLTATMMHPDRANVTMDVVTEGRHAMDRVTSLAKENPLSFFVLKSSRRDVFNFGGDFHLFLDAIAARDHARLKAYGRGCVDIVHAVYSLADHGVTTMASIAGDALGGGFELALACDFIVAERTAKLGVPESRFAGFPGMGAYSLLTRKIGRRDAEDLIVSGRLLSGEEAFDLGLVDFLAEDGELELGTSKAMQLIDKKRSTYRSLVKARRHVDRLTLTELQAIVDDWVDHSMALSPRDQQHMRRLISAQARATGASVVPLRKDASGGTPPKSNPFTR